MSLLPNKPAGKAKPPTNFKKSRLYSSRIIRTELNDSAFTNPNSNNRNKNIISNNNTANKLDIPTFMKSREFEIKEFEKSQLRSKHSNSTRVFQQLPRSMRRRTASHNVKRIPKRLRVKALREMGLTMQQPQQPADSTKGVDGTGKPKSKKHPRGRHLYNLRRRVKLLKYGARLKLSGQLPNGELITLQKMDMRNKLKLLKDQINLIESGRKLKSSQLIGEKDIEMTEDSPFSKEKSKQETLLKQLNNNIGSYDNTSINSKAKIHKLTSLKYATRQAKYKWLPTHIWHAKRAQMIKQHGWNLVYAPTQKCFRNTSRSSRVKGCLIWDNSFINTIILNCYTDKDAVKRQKLLDLIGGLTQKQAIKKKKMNVASFWQGFINIENSELGPGFAFWNEDDDVLQCVLRIHPSIYDTVMDYLLQKIKGSEFITLHDCKYSIGSIKLSGPKALNALESILYTQKAKPNSESYKIWRNFKNLNDVKTIPSNIQFSFKIDDPRLITKPISTTSKQQITDDLLDNIIALKEGKGVDRNVVKELLSIEGRQKSYDKQLSLNQLSKLRMYQPGQPMECERSPEIPIIINRLKDGYEVMMPWFWVMPFWYQLVHVPHVQIGGLKQSDQLNFENGELNFNDLVFTKVGYTNSLIKLKEMERKWKRRPKAKRVAYDKLKFGKTHIGEVGSAFGCDWRYLQLLRILIRKVKPDSDVGTMRKGAEFNDKFERVINTENDVFEAIKDIEKVDNENQIKGTLLSEVPVKLSNNKSNLGDLESIQINPKSIPQLPITPITFTCSNRGHIKDNARIYRIPENELSEWYEFEHNNKRSIKGGNKSSFALGCPSKSNLIGFVTSATFNLTKGCSTGVGFVDFEETRHELVVIRNIGSNVCCVAKFCVINV